MRKLKQYVGLDARLKETSIAVIDENDRLIWRGSMPSKVVGVPVRVRRRL
jgi:hypothetical protein